MSKSCIDIINALLKWFSKEYGEDGNGNDNEDNGNGGEPIEFGVCKDSDILAFWNEHKVVWACDQSKFGMEDEWFHFPFHIADWLEVYYDYADVCPPYTSNTEEEAGFDCDDFADGFPAWAKLFSIDLLDKRANAVWEIWGDTPQGPHGWNAMMAGDGMYEIEPQTGEAFIFGSNPSYVAVIAK